MLIRCLSFLLLLTVLLWGEQTVVTLKANATVHSSDIHLGDVAEIHGEYASLLDTLTVARSTRPGFSRLLLKDELLSFTKLSDEIRSTVVLEGAGRCTVSSLGREIRLEDIESRLMETLSEKLKWGPGTWNIRFNPRDSVLAHLWDDEYIFELGNLRSDALKGRVMLPLVFLQGKNRERLSLPAEITVVEKVAVAVRRLNQGENLGIGDYRWEKMDITRLPYEPVTDFDKTGEYQVRTGVIAAGSVITVNKIRKNRVVERGATVRIFSKVGTASVVVTGRARQSGDLGDVITVENSVSKKIIRGKIVKPGVVQVNRGGDV